MSLSPRNPHKKVHNTLVTRATCHEDEREKNAAHKYTKCEDDIYQFVAYKEENAVLYYWRKFKKL